MITRRRIEWRDQASCLGQDPELFFPLGTQSPAASAQIAEAKQVCARCPVRTPCLDWALQTGIDNGIWGGQDETERRTTRRYRHVHAASGG